MSVLSVKNISVYAGKTCLLSPISFALEKTERLTILGQTGAGKSLLAQAIMGNLPKALSMQGIVQLSDKQIEHKSQLRKQWGHYIGILPQEPWNSMDPLMPAAKQLSETYHLVANKSLPEASYQAQMTLTEYGLSDSAHKRVDELSGGMAQRLAITCATAGGAKILLADEPTKGLDVSRRNQVVAQLLKQTAQGVLVTITHDVSVARQIGGRVLVMKEGAIVEAGMCEQILNAPQHDYTKMLIATDPQNWQTKTSKQEYTDKPLLQVEDLTIGRANKPLTEGLSFAIHGGEVVGVVGDSGCGKSTLGDTLLGLLPQLSGQIQRQDNLSAPHWQKLYQDPIAAVSKAVPLRKLLNDVVVKYGLDRKRIAPLMKQLGLTDDILSRRANAVSGGELQRFCLLRVLLLNPTFLFADEPTSRLDPVTTKEVMDLLLSVAEQTQCAILLVSHDPYLIEKSCDRVIYLN